ncbi:MAG TPA: 50S rRNA methyltransferase [Treponema sp.]|nr:50S rRNA methyltransferase [Treponema sp.]
MADYKKPDFWQLKAQKEGYPARSVYKLKEMDEKFGLFKAARNGKQGANFRALDLGAAPGSWSLYAMRTMRDTGFLAAADLSPLSRQYDKGLFDRDNFFFIQGDFTDPVIRHEIISRGPYHLIISDAAPATTGNRSIDTARSLELAESVTAYAEDAMEKGGTLAIKVFQGQDTISILQKMKTLFTSAKSFKPQACRSESFEMYYLGIDYSPPANSSGVFA